MIVPEDYAKKLLKRYGLRIPSGGVAPTPDEAAIIAQGLGSRGVVKALIPTGGRGKAGGVQVCRSSDQVRDTARSLLGRDLLGHTVSLVLVEELIPVTHEMYAGVVVNSETSVIDLIFGFSGGMEIETAAQAGETCLSHLEVEPGDLLPVHRVRRWLNRAEAPDVDLSDLALVLTILYRAAADLDAMLLEVNPLALAEDGSLVALDCKLEVDDNGLARQPDLLELYQASLDERAARGRELCLSFVPLDGDIAVITSGAGLGLATLDLLVQAGLSPANFLDTGGGISEGQIKGALEFVMEPPQVKGAIVNLYGGINRMLEAAKGIVAALENISADRPIVAKILGNQQEQAWALLEDIPSVHVVRTVETEAAVARLHELVR